MKHLIDQTRPTRSAILIIANWLAGKMLWGAIGCWALVLLGAFARFLWMLITWGWWIAGKILHL